MSQSESAEPTPSPAEAAESSEAIAEQAAQKKARELKLAVAIIVLWIVTGVSLYLERDHWFSSPKPQFNTAVSNRSSD